MSNISAITEEIEIDYCPHPSQEIVHNSKARYKVIVCGRRWGKTTLAINELIRFALLNNNSYLWLCSPTYKQSKMIAWRMLKRYIPEEFEPRYNEAELSITFPYTGSVIELKGADNENSLRGAGLDGMVVDEFASIYNNWSVWNEVLRPALTDKKGWVLFIGTPKGKDAFFELYMKGIKKENGYQSFRFKTVDNPFIDAQEVEEARRTMPGRYFRQEYEASFEDFTGLIYPEFNEADHVIEVSYVPKHYPRIGAIDPAISGTTGVLKAFVDENGCINIYEEFYESDKRASEVVETIKEDDVKWYIDPASAASNIRREGKLYSLYDEYLDCGIHAEAAENDVEAGINRVGEFFRQGKIMISSKCTNLIWELERYHWAEQRDTITGATKPRPYKKHDHLSDCLRYLTMSRPFKADLNRIVEPNPQSAWGRYQLQQQERDGFTY